MTLTGAPFATLVAGLPSQRLAQLARLAIKVYESRARR